MKEDEISGLFERNRAWAKRLKRRNPDFFANLSERQSPRFLWIGCSDSRVPANVVLDLPPGEVFVHRNIANVVAPSDLNLLSVLQYAVEVLEINHVIVCGHYGCGGVRAALSDASRGLLDDWLDPLRQIRKRHADRFTDAVSEDEQTDLLCELNVVEQVNHVCATAIVRDAWARGAPLIVHGIIYDMRDGILHKCCTGARETGAAKPAGTHSARNGRRVTAN